MHTHPAPTPHTYCSQREFYAELPPKITMGLGIGMFKPCVRHTYHALRVYWCAKNHRPCRHPPTPAAATTRDPLLSLKLCTLFCAGNCRSRRGREPS